MSKKSNFKKGQKVFIIASNSYYSAFNFFSPREAVIEYVYNKKKDDPAKYYGVELTKSLTQTTVERPFIFKSEKDARKAYLVFLNDYIRRLKRKREELQTAIKWADGEYEQQKELLNK